MKKLIHEIHRRSLWQVLGIYLAATWIVLQVIDVIGSNFGLPEWMAPVALVLLLIGLPVVLATAFVQEGVTKHEPATASASVEHTAEGPPTETAGSPRSASLGSSPHKGLLTWRNAMVGGVGALALLGLLSAGWIASRAFGIGPAATLQARGVIDDQALVVLADFEAADEEIAAAATEALRVDLSQSTAIRLADQAFISAALERMERQPEDPLTDDVARELARREGAGAVIQGGVIRAGEGYVFSAQLVDATDGSTLTSQRATADGAGDVIAAIEGLSKKLRERIGESMGSIRAGEPLARVTTDNLEALELYSRAQKTGGGDRLQLLEQAVALDSGFAMAWNGIATRLRNSISQRARMVAARTTAYEQRARLTRRERHLTSALYFIDVLGEPARAVPEFRAMIELDSLDSQAINDLGVAYHELRQHDLSEQLYLRWTQINPDRRGPGFWNLIQTRINLGKFAEARETADTMAARFGGGASRYERSIIAGNEGDFDGAEAVLEEWLDSLPTVGRVRGFRARIGGDLGAMLAAQGRVAEAGRQFGDAEAITRPLNPVDFWEDAIQHAWMTLVVRDRPEMALRQLAEAGSKVPLDSLRALDRPYGPLVELYARAGGVEAAHALMDDLRREIPPAYEVVIREEVARAEGEIALAEGRIEEAIAAFRRSDVGECTICALTGLGAAYDRAGQADSAIAVYTRYVETPYADRYASYAYPLGPALGPVHERLGQLYDELGDLENAVQYYAMFVELWADADEELQPRVRAAQARLEEILRERG